MPLKVFVMCLAAHLLRYNYYEYLSAVGSLQAPRRYWGGILTRLFFFSRRRRLRSLRPLAAPGVSPVRGPKRKTGGGGWLRRRRRSRQA